MPVGQDDLRTRRDGRARGGDEGVGSVAVLGADSRCVITVSARGEARYESSSSSGVNDHKLLRKHGKN